MSTNNQQQVPETANLKTDSLQSRPDFLPDPALLEALVIEYFPEFTPQGAGGYAGTAPVNVPNTGPTGNGLAAEDILKAIPAALRIDDGGAWNVGLQGAECGFAFLENAGVHCGADSQPAVGINAALPNRTAGFWNGFKQVELVEVAGGYQGQYVGPHLAPTVDQATGHFDVNAVRRDFPILAEKVNGKDLIWLDNAATTQKPQPVIERLTYYYTHENSNVHRGAHTLAARSTDAYEGARAKISRFLNAPSAREIVFVRGTTEGINLVAQSWGRYNLGRDDEIVITWLEHHANIVPWQMICAETGANLRVAPVDDTGQILLEEYAKLLSEKTKLVAITQVSNALGTITPVAEMIEMAHRVGARVLIDGAQAVSHLKVDVQALDCDFYVFSGHKIFGPTGIGVLYAKPEVLDVMHPYQGGGNMIADVTFKKTVYQDPPHRFEAGTGNIGDAVGLGAAIDYVNSLGIENIYRYEHQLLEYGGEILKSVPGLRLIGTAQEKTSVLSFVLAGFTTEEVGKALSREGIAVRSGHHCAQPILRRFGLESTVRPSLAFYNTYAELDILAEVLRNLKSSRNFG